MNLNRVDLNTRLQYINCCYSAICNDFANDLKYGRKCTTKDKIDLAILAVYMEILECYQIIPEGSTDGSSTLSSGVLTILIGAMGDNITIYLDGVSIAVYSVVSSNEAVTMTAIAALLTTAGYPSTFDGTQINIVGPCTNGVLSYTAQKSEITISGFTGGGCGIVTPANCFSEEEIQDLLEKVSLLTGLCFNPPGFTYEVPEGYIMNSDGTISPE